MLDAAATECQNHFGKLANLEPDDFVHERRERGIGFIFKRDGDEPFDAGGARLPRELQRQRAVAGDETQRFERDVQFNKECCVTSDR